jgi:multicomponent Na+:H+ antiporter subunit D
VWLVVVPALTFVRVLFLTPGIFGEVNFVDWSLIFGRVDRLSNIFGYVMSLMAVLGTVYALHVEDSAQHIASWFYVAGALGAIYAGDFLTLFLFWELMAFSSVFLIWHRGSRAAVAAGYRYLLVHVAGGVALLAGIVFHCRSVNSWTFMGLHGLDQSVPVWLILTAFLLNAAAPPFHAWLPDAYAEGTFSGSVFLSAFTTKTAVYALCRGFAGWDILVPLGVVMALYGVIYAVLENDCRRLLAYHIISQVGYMVAAVGLGTELAINGACAHAFAHILYKGLLFMGCGAVLHMTGKSKFTELGGLYDKMPLAFAFTLIGGLSISAFPLFSGFVSKSIIVQAGFESHRNLAAFLLMLASGGTFLHTGLKIPYFIWFGRRYCSEEVWKKAADPPWNMNLAMAAAAALCIMIGCYTPYLYGRLPYALDYEPYTAYHVFETLQLLIATALGFCLLSNKLQPEPTISLDLDWLYRKGGRMLLRLAHGPIQTVDSRCGELYRRLGLLSLMGCARSLGRWDSRIVDGSVDGLARAVAVIGGRLRCLQRGSVQQTLAISFGVLVALVVAYLGVYSVIAR